MSHVSPGPEPTEFRYRDDDGTAGAVWVLFVSVLFMFSALLAVGWAIAALLHASWLDSGGLPGESSTTWGIVLLCVAAIEGLCGVLVFFSRRIGFLLGVGLALLHASWLDSGGLPGESSTTWGIVLLCVAAIEGLCGVLVFFSRRIGFVLGVGLAVLGIAGHLAVISAYPLWSIAGIAVYVLIIGILLAHRPRR